MSVWPFWHMCNPPSPLKHLNSTVKNSQRNYALATVKRYNCLFPSSPKVLNPPKNSLQTDTAALTWKDKHETVYTSYQCYFWWQRRIKTKLKAKGEMKIALEIRAPVFTFKCKSREKSASSLTGVPKSSRENGTIKKRQQLCIRKVKPVQTVCLYIC